MTIEISSVQSSSIDHPSLGTLLRPGSGDSAMREPAMHEIGPAKYKFI
jgi:hypothetical protein